MAITVGDYSTTTQELVTNPKAWGPGSLKFLFCLMIIDDHILMIPGDYSTTQLGNINQLEIINDYQMITGDYSTTRLLSWLSSMIIIQKRLLMIIDDHILVIPGDYSTTSTTQSGISSNRVLSMIINWVLSMVIPLYLVDRQWLSSKNCESRS